jgi:tRNA(fMet)-specific endonuclease VapC
MVAFCLDADICISALRGKARRFEQAVREHAAEGIGVSSIVEAELLLGAAKSARSEQNARIVRIFVSRFIILPFDSRCAERYAWLRAELESRGAAIGANDMLIAATALAESATLVTSNRSEFLRVAGLQIADWL